jgi:fluoride ion exporter CrcB/FEX
MPGIGISVFIGAVGAIMRYAVTATTQGFNIHTGGVILMFVGVVGALLSLLFWSSFSPWSRSHRASNSRRVETTTEDGHESGRVVSETHDRSGA